MSHILTNKPKIKYSCLILSLKPSNFIPVTSYESRDLIFQSIGNFQNKARWV